jgi:hypothetical protein
MYLKIDEFNHLDDIPDYYNFQKPYLIRGGCRSMKIFNREDKMQFFLQHLQDTKLDTEIYNTMTQMEQSKIVENKQISFSESFEHNIRNKKPYHFVAEVNLKEPRYNISSKFLSNFHLDMDNKRDNPHILMFFGNNSRSATHIHVTDDYVFNQIYGSKTVYMFDYNDNKFSANFNPGGVFSDRSNFIEVDLFSIDHSNLKIYKVEMNEGDSLTIPPWWWHAVKGKDLTLTLTKTYPRSNYWYALTKPYLMIILIYQCIMMIIDDILDFVDDLLDFFNSIFKVIQSIVFNRLM